MGRHGKNGNRSFHPLSVLPLSLCLCDLESRMQNEKAGLLFWEAGLGKD